MEFEKHSELIGKHAVLSASQYAWLNYTAEKLETVYINKKKAEEGTLLHAFASLAITQRIKLAPIAKALNAFVNDAIGFKMESEVVLCYSDNAFGTADAISFKDNTLRIFDLKTGRGKVSFNQLDIYAAYFCLEYNVKPHKIEIIQRIYQGNGFTEIIGDPDVILDIMMKTKQFDKVINNLKDSI